MGMIQTIERQGRPLDQREEVSHPTGAVASLLNLSTWIIFLGSVRLALAVAEGLLAGLDAVRNEPMSIQRWAAFFRDNPPITMLGALWPPFLGVALRRTRWPELLKVAALTFLILSVGGMLSLIADWGDSRANWLAVGSFSISRPCARRPGMAVHHDHSAGADPTPVGVLDRRTSHRPDAPDARDQPGRFGSR